MERHISQTVVQGTLSTPWVFSSLLMAMIFLLGVSVTELYWVNQNQQRLQVEVRLLEVHVQDTNAILIREGLMRPGDKLHGPTSGETP